MRLTLLATAVLLCACASSGSARYAAVPSGPASLPPQTLAAGECGLFGWDANGAFVFFATPSRGQFLGATEVVTLDPQGEFPALEFDAVAFEAGTAQPMIDGRRYPFARITETLEDGFTRVRPLVVLETCQVPDSAPLQDT